MTTTPTEPTVSIQTVDSTGKLGTLPLDSLLPQPVEGEPLEAEFAIPSLENAEHIPPGAAVTANLDTNTLYYLLVKKGQPCVLTPTSTAEKHASVSARVRVNAEAALTLSGVTFYMGVKPTIIGHGYLLLTRVRILESGKENIVWEAGWTPLVRA